MALQNIDLMSAEVFEAKLSQYIRGVVQHDKIIGLIRERDRSILEAAADRMCLTDCLKGYDPNHPACVVCRDRIAILAPLTEN